MADIRSTDDGRQKQNESERQRNADIRSNAVEREKHNENERQRNADKRYTDKRYTERNEEEERIRTLPFLPKLDDKTDNQCIQNFINAKTPRYLKTHECGICGIAVKETQSDV